MLTPKKLHKVTKDNEVTVFENGTVLGSVIVESDEKCNLTTSINEEQISLVAIDEQCESSYSANCSMVSVSPNISLVNFINRSEHSAGSVANESIQSENLNSSTCSYESRQSKRLRRKFRKFNEKQDHLPPQYTTIYLDGAADPTAGTLNHLVGPLESAGHMPLSVPVTQRSASATTTGRVQVRFFRVPSIPFVIGILALGGVACTLGGIVLGSTGLIEHSTQYLSAALLMIGIGVSLLVISGAIWKLTVTDEPDTCPCCRHLETCRNCNSMFCNSRILPGSYIYPEFQHRIPPPSYITSLNECTAAVGLLVRESTYYQRDSHQIATTPPPSYRSYSSNSLSICVPVQNLSDVQAQESKVEDSALSDKEAIYVELE